MQKQCALRDEPVRGTLLRLHAEARGDWVKFLGITPRYLAGVLRGRQMHEVITPSVARDIYMPVSPEKGEFLYITARAVKAPTIVEFGTSFGLSTIYLAAVVRDNGGGRGIGGGLLELLAVPGVGVFEHRRQTRALAEDLHGLV